MVEKNFSELVRLMFQDYPKTTPKKLKIIDAYMVYILLTGIVQFIYCVFLTSYPFNAFLAGFISTVASFVLAASLRSQVDPSNCEEFKNISPERAFADFCLAHVVLHLVVANVLG
ncbi:Dolichyl-diphosphooligosaccharide--protein glycosyltransferase subunit DAD1 [Strongyloides ratti]|uniref:Dolichyl-diphosphooligosaccharide--protein glycosyltransferase subunit DAD1 n=1 Tax=Strongyloides ratti TaxID=34506 RepID=A0A090LL97_STRRB|nr:Dolichyl-diphosphooligosaccharide--protein glycosyltransferase subunit DAD1 [Strongyloides ratti]CEF68305.1 Dolichyl-diphosphooligosaccharide--protein glycosyltransferase subunit DAD1 [Strongyloides ratti]